MENKITEVFLVYQNQDLVRKLKVLEKDFCFNLELIEQRDRDLLHQEKEIDELQATILELY
jgi:DNA-dependent RNA polymerase auxiliary subunit epsilon